MIDENQTALSTDEGTHAGARKPVPCLIQLTPNFRPDFSEFLLVISASASFYVNEDRAIGTPKLDLMTDISAEVRDGHFKPKTLKELRRWICIESVFMREHGSRTRAKLGYANDLWAMWKAWGGAKPRDKRRTAIRFVKPMSHSDEENQTSRDHTLQSRECTA
jgi:hypothetical protein